MKIIYALLSQPSLFTISTLAFEISAGGVTGSDEEGVDGLDGLDGVTFDEASDFGAVSSELSTLHEPRAKIMDKLAASKTELFIKVFFTISPFYEIGTNGASKTDS